MFLLKETTELRPPKNIRELFTGDRGSVKMVRVDHLCFYML